MGNNDMKKFLTRAAVVTAAVVLVMYLAKSWFVGPQSFGFRTPGANNRGWPGATKTGTSVISWKDAARHCDEWITVEGTIVATYNSGKACFLNFHPDYKRYFTAVIFASAFSRFPHSPEVFYRGKKVRITGYIKDYRGKPEIIVNDPGEIEILK